MEKLIEWYGGDVYCEFVLGGEFILDIFGEYVVCGVYVEIDLFCWVVFIWGMEGGYQGNFNILFEGLIMVEVMLEFIEMGI